MNWYMKSDHWCTKSIQIRVGICDLKVWGSSASSSNFEVFWGWGLSLIIFWGFLRMRVTKIFEVHLSKTSKNLQFWFEAEVNNFEDFQGFLEKPQKIWFILLLFSQEFSKNLIYDNLQTPQTLRRGWGQNFSKWGWTFEDYWC